MPPNWAHWNDPLWVPIFKAMAVSAAKAGTRQCVQQVGSCIAKLRPPMQAAAAAATAAAAAHAIQRTASPSDDRGQQVAGPLGHAAPLPTNSHSRQGPSDALSELRALTCLLPFVLILLHHAAAGERAAGEGAAREEAHRAQRRSHPTMQLVERKVPCRLGPSERRFGPVEQRRCAALRWLGRRAPRPACGAAAEVSDAAAARCMEAVAMADQAGSQSCPLVLHPEGCIPSGW